MDLHTNGNVIRMDRFSRESDGAKGRIKSNLTRAQSLTFDHMAFQYGMPTYVGIDVEEREAAILHEARQTLQRVASGLRLELNNQIVAADVGGRCSAPDELAELGYSLSGLDGTAFSQDYILGNLLLRVVATRAQF